MPVCSTCRSKRSARRSTSWRSCSARWPSAVGARREAATELAWRAIVERDAARAVIASLAGCGWPCVYPDCGNVTCVAMRAYGAKP